MRNRRYLTAIGLIASLSIVWGGAVSADRPSDISLKQAIDHAMTHSPMLAAVTLHVKAEGARLEGREGAPNPEFSLDAEDFLGSGGAKGGDAIQITAALSQEIPLGGKVGAIRRVNETRKSTAMIERDIAEQTVTADVTMTYLGVIAAQQRLSAVKEMAELAKATMNAIQLQVDAGRATPIEVDKASIVLALATLDQDRMTRQLTMAKQQLAAACGETSPFFDSVHGSLNHIRAMPNLEKILLNINHHPAMQSNIARVKHQEALAKLEHSRRIPNLALSLGYRWMNAAKESALVAGIAVPIPILDRNTGSIRAASVASQAYRTEGEQTRVTLHRDITDAFERLASEHQRATVLKAEVLPKVQSTFDAISEGYRLGRFGYLDLLDAQRTLFEIKDQTLEALLAYHQTVIILNQTAALPLPSTLFEPSASKERSR